MKLGTRFLCNDQLWQNIRQRAKKARRVWAAVAYFGMDGDKLLPLKKGDKLLVDMSEATLKAGQTNPFAIEKLQNKGVLVFRRENLHAKFFIFGNSLLAGSANVSSHSVNCLDEAGILTNERNSVQAARVFFRSMLTEPVTPEYLKQCKKWYRPSGNGWHKGPRTRHPKLWLVTLMRQTMPPDVARRWDTAKARAEARMKEKDTHEVEGHFADAGNKKLVVGDWVIPVFASESGRSVRVYPPGTFLYRRSYVRNKKTGRRRHLFFVEVPKQGQTMSWREFRKRTRSLLPKLSQPRDQLVKDVLTADKVMLMWTQAGRLSRKAKR